jgi:hypothetical protein
MTFRKSHALLLSYVASLLTLAASGDDINLYRLVMPVWFAEVPVGSLPLDDENTDFIKSPAPQTSQNPETDWNLPACRLAARIRPVSKNLTLSFMGAASRQHPLAPDSAMTPLRC